MRPALVLMIFLVGCGSTGASSGSSTPEASPLSGSQAQPCAPTSYRDASGVFTADGTFGVLGDTSTLSATAMNEPLVLVRKGAKENEQIALRFDDIGHSSPATRVAYSVGAKARANPWSAFVFDAGWKPIGFAGSCWRVVADGVDTGLVLEVRP
jgi:hypothetical protein